MSEFTAQCPSCGFSFSTDQSSIGITTTCASCSKDFIVQLGQEITNEGCSTHIRPDEIRVTSGDLHNPYKIVGMICFTVGTRGEMRNAFESLKVGITHKLAGSKGQISKAKSVGQFIGGVGLDSSGDITLAGQYAGATFNSSDLEAAFHIAVNQLQLRASYLNANAVIGFRYNIDLDSDSNVLNFIAVAYGTAVRMNA